MLFLNMLAPLPKFLQIKKSNFMTKSVQHFRDVVYFSIELGEGEISSAKNRWSKHPIQDKTTEKVISLFLAADILFLN